jgi:glycogen operon protein
MLLAGDEVGNSQGGNNNAYAQDNDTGWIDWTKADRRLAAFVARLAALRRDHPVLRQKRFLHARPRPSDGLPDVIWRRADGTTPRPEDWHDPSFRCLGVELRSAAEAEDSGAGAIFALFNAGADQTAVLPQSKTGWQLILDTTRPEAPPETSLARVAVPAQSVLVFAEMPPSGGPT